MDRFGRLIIAWSVAIVSFVSLVVLHILVLSFWEEIRIMPGIALLVSIGAGVWGYRNAEKIEAWVAQKP